MIELAPAERRALRARAHRLHPVAIIGDAGLTPEVLKEIDVALRSHELIKIRVLGEDRAQRRACIAEISRNLEAAPVQEIGKVLIVYRPRPPEAAAPVAPRQRRGTQKGKRRTKRSYQME